MTKVVGTPLRGIDFNSPSDEAVSARISGDTHPRIRIDAGGRITWSTGSAAGDTKLYRTDSGTLLTEGYFSASAGIVTRVLSSSPTFSAPNGTIVFDSDRNALYVRASDQWVKGGGAGANVTVSDTAPAEPEIGDLWFDSTDATTYIYYDSFWIDINGSVNTAPDIEQLNNVSIDFLADGDIIAYNSLLGEWTNIPVFSANPAANTTLSSSTAAEIGHFATAYYDSGEFFVEMKQGVKRLATKLNIICNASSVAFAQYGTAEIGSIPVTFSADISGPNVRLLASVSDAGSSNVTVQTTKSLIRHF